ncbi:hypothetical protein [Gordonia iterans]
MTQPPNDPNAADGPNPHEPAPGEPYASPGQPYQAPHDPGGQIPGAHYQGSEYPGSQIPGAPYQGSPYPSGEPYAAPGYGAPAPLTSRPGAVTGAAVVLLAFGAFLAIFQVIGLVSGSTVVMYDGEEYRTAATIGGIVGLIISIFAIFAGYRLLSDRTSTTRIIATVAAALLILTCWGIVATIAVPILLFATDSAKQWFAQQPPAAPGGYPPAPGQY